MEKNKKRLKKISLSILIVVFCVFNLQSFDFARAADELEETKDEIESVEKKLEREKKALEIANSNYSKVTAQVNTTSSLIKQTETEISRKEAEIKNLNDRISLYKNILSAYIQEVYFSDQDPIIKLATNESLDKVFGNVDQMVNTKEKILGILDEIKIAQEKLGEVKEELAEKKEDHENLLRQKKVEQGEIAQDIQESQKTIDQLSSKLNALRSEYSRILGKAVSTNDILKAADFAAKATGMSKAFLLGVLIQESNKGQSTGSCDYKESRMSSAQLTAFKAICKELGYDYRKQNVSCPPKNYKGTGGAMGVPQFMPTTWQGYKSIIASYSGNNPPDPWNLVDGVVAMASKLSRDGASKKTRFAEAKSYCVYLAGGNWGYYCFGTDKYKKSYEDVNCWGSSIRNYGEKVLCLKDNYEKYY